MAGVVIQTGGLLPEARDASLDVMTLELPESGTTITNWESYTFESNYLTPSDGFRFEIGDDITDEDLTALGIGAEVTLKVNGVQQASGYIDEVEIRNDRFGGTKVSVTGRDKLGYMVDSGVDPRMTFKEGQTLEDVVRALATPFGFTTFFVDGEAVEQRDAKRGKRGTKTTKKGKPLKSFVVHQLKPYPCEGAFQFMARILQRHGLWAHPDATSNLLFIGTPDFEQRAIYRLQRRRGAAGVENNVLAGSVHRSGQDQPSVVLASGHGGGGEFARASLRSAYLNPMVAPEDLTDIATAWPGLQFQSIEVSFLPYPSKRARPMYLYDDESKTQDQLDAFVRRELSLRMRKALTAHYTVAGHVCDGNVWDVDSIVEVDDEVTRLHQSMWVLGRRLTKSRRGGTTTDLELICPGSLQF
jgi:prophage tail gpP-like protein